MSIQKLSVVFGACFGGNGGVFAVGERQLPTLLEIWVPEERFRQLAMRSVVNVNTKALSCVCLGILTLAQAQSLISLVHLIFYVPESTPPPTGMSGDR